MGPLVIPAIAAGTQLLSSGIGLAGQARANKKNLELAKYSYEKDLEMWNRQNLYNLPSAQMDRLQQAGLNPNLVYGSGTAVPLSAPAPKMGTPEYKLDTRGMIPQTTEILGAYQQMQLQKAQTDNVEAQTANTKIEGINKAIQTAILEADAQKRGIDLETLKATQPYQVDIVKSRAESARYAVEQALRNLGKTDAEIALLKARVGLTIGQTNVAGMQVKTMQTQNEIAKQELILKRFEALWAEKGITRSDSLPVRIISRILDEAGESLQSGYDKVLEFIKSLPYLGEEVYDKYFKPRTGATGGF